MGVRRGPSSQDTQTPLTAKSGHGLTLRPALVLAGGARLKLWEHLQDERGHPDPSQGDDEVLRARDPEATGGDRDVEGGCHQQYHPPLPAPPQADQGSCRSAVGALPPGTDPEMPWASVGNSGRSGPRRHRAEIRHE
ncbi:hypothetical protein P7K49_020661, partial [Saguinus oedipus]